MARYFNIKITEVHSDGPFTVYYDSVDAANIATLYPDDTPAENITRADLTSATGIEVYIPDDSTSVILYNTDANIIAGCNVNTVTLAFDVTPTPTPTVTVTPTPTNTPTPTPTTPVPGVGVSIGTVSFIETYQTHSVSFGGVFEKLNDQIRNGFIETNADGTQDNNFWNEINPGFYFYNIRTTAIDQTTGVKFIGGGFDSFKNSSVSAGSLGKKGIVKLDSNGVIDESFNTNLASTYPGNRRPNDPTNSVGTLVDLLVRDIKVDGTNVFIAAETKVNPFDKREYIIKTDYDGNVDVSFLQNQGIGSPNLASFNVCAIASDGGILVGGKFSEFNGLTRSLLFKLKSDGTLDSDFESNKGQVTQSSREVNSIAIQSDGSIIVGGTFTSWNNETVGNIVKLASDGTYDTDFTDNVGDGNVGGNFGIKGIGILADDSIIVGGDITNFNGVEYPNNILKLSSTGVWDDSFITIVNDTIHAVEVDQVNNIYVGGNFTQLADSKDFIGNYEYRDRSRIAKLNSSGTEIQSWYLNLATS